MRTTVLLAPLLLGAAACSSGGGEGPRPNVLLVTLDTTRADAFSCYDATASPTPAFDALAEDGVRFANASSSSAVTPVAHATILTGLFQHRHGVRVISADSGFRLEEDVWYLPQAMKDAGWSTAAVQSAFPVSGHFGFARSFDEFHDFDGDLEVAKRPGGMAWDMDELQRRSDAATDLAIEVLGRLPDPFFLWMHYWDPHDTLETPPEEFLAERGIRKKQRGKPDFDALYAAEVEYLDGEFGRLLDHLRETGRYDDTVVVVTADHGEGLSDGLELHGWRGHRMLYREQLHVPLILRLPDALEERRGLVVDQLVRTADVVPTLLDYLGLPAPLAFDGASLRPLVRGEQEPPRLAYSDQVNGYDKNAHMVEKRPDAAFLYSVNDGEWKLVYRPHMPERSELFHVAVDPTERRNLYGSRPAVERRLLGWLAQQRPWVTAPFPPDGTANEDVSGALGALGYTEGAVSDAEWNWTCPEHGDRVFEEERPCGVCDEPPIPVQAP